MNSDDGDRSNVLFLSAFSGKGGRGEGSPEKFIKLPPATLYSIVLLLLIHLAFSLCPSGLQFRIFSALGFVPGIYTGAIPFEIAAVAAPLTYMLLHGSWTHVVMNSVMLGAFGSGVEKLMGAGRFLAFMICCGLVSAVTQLVISPFSTDPVIGASGAISGLFAAAMTFLYKRGAMPAGRYGLLPTILVWVVFTLAFGAIGGPDGEQVAWGAHLGGFLGGFLLLKIPFFVKGSGMKKG